MLAARPSSVTFLCSHSKVKPSIEADMTRNSPNGTHLMPQNGQRRTRG